VDENWLCVVALLGAEELGKRELREVVEGNLLEGLGHLVGEKVHPGQRGVRVGPVLPRLLGALLVRVGPVVDLVLEELTLGERTEGGAREVEVVVDLQDLTALEPSPWWTTIW
jgi:hypothetical protein